MRTTTSFAISALFCLGTQVLCAQKVLYSPFVGYEPGIRFEVIGKVGNYYWIQKSRKKFSTKKVPEPWVDDKGPRFEIYDAKMNLVKAIPFLTSTGFIQEYLIPGENYFDQLMLQPGGEKTYALVDRYSPEGEPAGARDTVGDFPGGMKCGDFLLVRSQNRSKILLLGFETVPGSFPHLHVMLFDSNWKLIYRTEYSDVNISKPLVQYDLVEYPLEDYNSTSIKLGNNGEWLMLVSSGMNHNYLLFHFSATVDAFTFREIKLPAGATVEDADIYLDNETGQGFAGVSSRLRTAAVKTVRVVHYILSGFQVDFDTSYFFNTLAGYKTKSENIFEEYFMIVPGRGFMFLKEYGRSFSAGPDADEPFKDNGQFTNIKMPHRAELPEVINRDDYTRYDNFAGSRNNFDRGDLTLYYFPSKREDTCWSGIINKQQITELGRSYLSYVFLPTDDKLYFLYNSLYRDSDPFSSATILDSKGNPVNEGVEYWKINNTLVFQKARQISGNEIAIPYERNQRGGFAIIRL